MKDSLEKLGWIKDDDNVKYLRYYNDYNSEISIYQIDIDLDNGVSLSGAIEVQDILALSIVLKEMLEERTKEREMINYE